MGLQRERRKYFIWSDLKLGGHLELNAILFQSWSKLRSRSKLTSFIGSNISRSSSNTTLWFLQVNHRHLKTNLQGLLSHLHILIFSKSNLKLQVFGLFSCFVCTLIIKISSPEGPANTTSIHRVRILAYLSFSFIPLQNILQKSVDRPVKNPQKRAESITMAPNAPDKILLAHMQQNASLLRGREHHFRTGERAE